MAASPGITFSHPNPHLNTLSLRLAPKEVDWSYNLVTSETNTYAGQVVQVLSVNFEKLTLVGQFGRESRSDYQRNGPAWTRISAPSVIASSSYGPGLTQMTEWFKRYFALASQGIQGDNFDEQPMTIRYQGTYDSPVDTDKSETTWKVYPTSFPSYRIANDNFAPEWRVECQVYEAPKTITQQVMDEAIARLSYSPLYQPGSKWSDPFPQFTGPGATQEDLRKAAQAAVDALQQETDHFISLLPAYTESDIADLISRGFSAPVTTKAKSKDKKVADKTGDPFASDELIPGTISIPDQFQP